MSQMGARRRRWSWRREVKSARRKWHRLPAWVRVLLVLVVAFLLLRATVWVFTRPTGIEAAAETCEVGLNVRDGGHSMTIQLAEGDAIELGRWMAPDDLSCVFDELEVPATIRDRIGGTRPIDGQQQDSWDGYSVRWWVSVDEANVIIEED